MTRIAPETIKEVCRRRILVVGDLFPWPTRDGYRLHFSPTIGALSEVGDVELFVATFDGTDSRTYPRNRAVEFRIDGEIPFQAMVNPPQRISYFPLEQMDESMLEEMQRCAREGTPRPESSAVRGHSELAFWAFAESWEKLYRNGVVDHSLKELCRVYVSRSVQCEYCGNQRSETARKAGLDEEKFEELVNFETSDLYDERQKTALSYAEAITWRLTVDDAFWKRLHDHFTEEELVELAGFICLTMGQQSWIRILNIQHHEVLAGTSAALAPGFESADALKETTSQSGYWAAKSLENGPEVSPVGEST